MAYNLSRPEKKTSGFAILLLAIILILPLVGGGGGAGPVVPVPATFILTSTGNGASYKAYLSASSTIPFFTETNFSRIMNNDILASASCLPPGCSIFLNPGIYNQTQSICPSQNNIYLSGTSASDIIIQKNTTNTLGVFSGCPGTPALCSASRVAFCITGANFTATGFQVDDTFRDGDGAIGDVFTIPPGTIGTTIQQVTVTHASSDGITAQGSKQLFSQNKISGQIPIIKVGGNYGIALGSTSDNTKVFLNTITGFNGSDVSAITVAVGAHNVSLVANTLIQNEFGILLNRAIGVTIQANTISNNYLGGIVIATALGSIKAGPLTISGNTFTNNGFVGETTFSGCANQFCGALQIEGNNCCWDTISITGNTFADKRVTLAQPYDINIPQGTQYTNVTIVGNTFGTTSTGTTINLLISLPKSWSIVDNGGWNPQPTTTQVATAGTFIYTNTIADKEQIILLTLGDINSFSCTIGGTGIAITRSVNNQTPVFGAGDTCTMISTVSPPTFDVIHQ